MKLPPADKLAHIGAGAIVYVAAALAVSKLTPYAALAPVAGLAAATLAGLAKEAHDRWQNRRAEKKGMPPPYHVEWLDAVATTLGGVLCYVGAAAVL